MKFIVKFFPEITIKSRPVRKRFSKQLQDNLSGLFRNIHAHILVDRHWDKIIVSLSENLMTTDFEGLRAAMIEVLSHTQGIAYFLEVVSYPLRDFNDIYLKTLAVYEERLTGKTFAVRCKRAGKHDFRSIDVERFVGGELNMNTAAAGVKLKNPDVTVRLEIRDETLFVVKGRFKGLGGFPLGTVDPVLSLISGGFDSTVASYLMMKRGVLTHFCFFNLGGRAHELGVKEVALFLWLKYGASHRIKFITVPFEEVVAEILKNVENSQMGVILKRMMLRAATSVAKDLGVSALVTGEAVAQVSSQTLANLAVIDSVTETLVLRPLIATNKTEIIALAAEIGTEEFAANMPEYCGVISVKPTTRAKPEKIQAEEEKFDFAVLERALTDSHSRSIDKIVEDDLRRAEVEVLSVPVQDSVIIDLRHPGEEELKPLQVDGVEIQKIPFYELHSSFGKLDQSRQYMLFCDKGMMSRLHASHLKEQGYENVAVFRPT